MSRHPLIAEIREHFLRLWSKAVGTPGYNRQEWFLLSRKIEEAVVYMPEGLGPEDPTPRPVRLFIPRRPP